MTELGPNDLLPLSSAFHEIVAERELAVPLSSAWERMRDLSIAHHYVPGASATEIRTREKTGLGTVRRVHGSAGRWVDETVMQWSEGEGFLLCVHRSHLGRLPPPIESVWFRYAVKKSELKDRCYVRLVFYYQLRGGVFVAVFRPLLHAMFRANLDRILRRLKMYYEIGCYVHTAFKERRS